MLSSSSVSMLRLGRACLAAAGRRRCGWGNALTTTTNATALRGLGSWPQVVDVMDAMREGRVREARGMFREQIGGADGLRDLLGKEEEEEEEGQTHAKEGEVMQGLLPVVVGHTGAGGLVERLVGMETVEWTGLQDIAQRVTALAERGDGGNTRMVMYAGMGELEAISAAVMRGARPMSGSQTAGETQEEEEEEERAISDRVLQRAEHVVSLGRQMQEQGAPDAVDRGVGLPEGLRLLSRTRMVASTELMHLVQSSMGAADAEEEGSIEQYQRRQTEAQRLRDLAEEAARGALVACRDQMPSELLQLVEEAQDTDTDTEKRNETTEDARVQLRTFARCQQQLGLVLSGKQDESSLAETWTCFKTAERAYKQALGRDDHYELADLYANMGVIQARRGKRKRALKLFKHVHAIREDTVGSKSARTAAALLDLGIAHQWLDQPEESIMALSKALSIVGDGNAPASDTDTGDAADDNSDGIAPTRLLIRSLLDAMAAALSMKGEFAEEEQWRMRAVAASEHDFGVEHLETTQRLNALAVCLDRQGRFETSEALYRKIIAVRTRHLGSSHPLTAVVHRNLGQALAQQMRFEDAEQHYRAALESHETHFGPAHPETMEARHSVAITLNMQGHPEDAAKMLQEGISLHDVHGGEGPAPPLVLVDLSAALLASGEIDEAEAPAQRAVTSAIQIGGLEDAVTATAYQHLGNVLMRKNNIPDALEAYQEAVEIREKILPEASVELAESFASVASCLEVQNATLAQALMQQGENVDEDDKEEYERRTAQVSEMWKRVLDIQHVAVGQFHPQTLMAQQRYAMALNAMGEKDQAEREIRTARDACLMASEQGHATEDGTPGDSTHEVAAPALYGHLTVTLCQFLLHNQRTLQAIETLRATLGLRQAVTSSTSSANRNLTLDTDLSYATNDDLPILVSALAMAEASMGNTEVGLELAESLASKLEDEFGAEHSATKQTRGLVQMITMGQVPMAPEHPANQA